MDHLYVLIYLDDVYNHLYFNISTIPCWISNIILTKLYLPILSNTIMCYTICHYAILCYTTLYLTIQYLLYYTCLACLSEWTKPENLSSKCLEAIPKKKVVEKKKLTAGTHIRTPYYSSWRYYSMILNDNNPHKYIVLVSVN